MEKEFPREVDRYFGFLATEFGLKRGVEKDREDLTISYADRRVRVRVILEGAFAPSRFDRAIRVDIGPLEDGKVPERLDPGLNLRLTSYDIEDMARLHDESWQTPPKRLAVRTPTDAKEVLASYAEQLRAHGQAALAGDATLFPQLADVTRRRLVAEYTKSWSAFVEQVCGGFRGSIAEYVEGISSRTLLQNFMQRWEGSRAEDPVDLIEELDGRFLACTEPLKFRYGPLWRLLPSPAARDWWRRPKVLLSPLREYFLEREAPT